MKTELLDRPAMPELSPTNVSGEATPATGDNALTLSAPNAPQPRISKKPPPVSNSYRRRIKDPQVLKTAQAWVEWLIKIEAHHHRDQTGAMLRLESEYGLSAAFLSRWQKRPPASIDPADWVQLTSIVERFSHARAREAMEVGAVATDVRLAWSGRR